jgi:hypothetical protein
MNAKHSFEYSPPLFGPKPNSDGLINSEEQSFGLAIEWTTYFVFTRCLEFQHDLKASDGSVHSKQVPAYVSHVHNLSALNIDYISQSSSS